MFEEINKRLEELSDGIYRYQKALRMVDSLKKQLFELERRKLDLKSLLQKETSDVLRLEKKSLASLFYTVLGVKKKQLEKEKQEALSASLKLSQCQMDIKNIQTEISDLTDEQAKYDGFEVEYQKLYHEKLDLLQKNSSDFLIKSHEIHDKIGYLKTNLKEIQEAVSAGEQVVISLNNAINKLDSAEGWGIFDIMGGGLVTDLIKHSHIDEAKEYVQTSQTLLRRFKTELADVKICDELKICTDGFTKFADFFFDGLIADWYMQTKISESKESVSRVKNKVQEILTRLKTMQEESREEISALELELSNYVVSA